MASSSTSISSSSTSMSSSMNRSDQKKASDLTPFVSRKLQRPHSFDGSRQRDLPAAETSYYSINKNLPINKQAEIFARLFPPDKDAKRDFADSLEKVFESKVPSKNSDEKLDSRDLCERFLSWITDGELSQLVDQVTICEEDGSENNPLDYIHGRVWGTCDQAVQKMALRYPVSDHHLRLVILTGYKPETIRAMFDQAILCERFTVQESLSSLIFQDYPDELILLFSKHADNVEYSAFKAAQSRSDTSPQTIMALRNKVSLDALIRYREPEELIVSTLVERAEADNQSLSSALSRPDISLTTIEAFLDKVPEVHEEVWENLFVRIFPPEHSGKCFFDSAFENKENRMALHMITPEFWDAYSKQFEGLPKPYIPHLSQASLDFIQKIFNRTSIVPISLLDLLGQADEATLKIFFSYRGKNISSFQLAHLLLYGYSEELVLDICDQLEDGDVDSDCIEAARLRKYSEAVIQKIETKCETLDLGWGSSEDSSDPEFEE